MHSNYQRLLLFLTGCFFISLCPPLFKHAFQEADIALLKYINLNRNAWFDPFFRLMTNSVAYVCILTLVLLICIRPWRRYLPYFIVSYLTAASLSTLLKYAILRERPFLTYRFIEKLTGGGSPSYPSGHTSDAFLLAGAIALVSDNRRLPVIMYTWAMPVAYSRMCLGVHYPSDVLAGMATASITAIVCFHYNSTALLPDQP